MKKTNQFISILMIIVFIMGNMNVQIAFSRPSGRKNVQFIVKYKNEKGLENAKQNVRERFSIASSKMQTKKTDKKLKMEVITVEDVQNPEQIMSEIEQDESISYVQEDYIMEVYSDITDPYYQLQWGMKNTGQEINGVKGTADADINIEEVWDKEKQANGLEEVVVGLLDTGVDFTHPDLKDKKVGGWDFVNGTNRTTAIDKDAHGTQVAGIIAANHDEFGMAGVAPNVKIMPLKFIENGYGYTSDAIEAIEYAASKGVKIINCSWGNTNYNKALKEVMEKYNDILFICAAGNNSSTQYVFPAAFDLSNVIAVTSRDNNLELAKTANFGTFVDVSAPGVDIYTTTLNKSHDFASGSSMAAGFVTGTAALFKGKYSDATANQIAESIKQASIKEFKYGKINTDEDANDKTISDSALTSSYDPIESTYFGEPNTTSGSSIDDRIDETTSGGAIESEIPKEDPEIEGKNLQLDIPFLDVEGILSFDYTKIPKYGQEKEIEPEDIEAIETSYTIDFENMPSDVKSLIFSDRSYTSLSESEKKLLQEKAFLREDTMTECSRNGFSIKESYKKAIIMQRHNFSVDEVLNMIDAFGNEDVALNESDVLLSYQYRYTWMNYSYKEEMENLLIAGYHAKDIGYAFIVAQALGLNIAEIIESRNYLYEEDMRDVTTSDSAIDFEAPPETEDSDESFSEYDLNRMAKLYRVQVAPIQKYMSEMNLKPEDIQRRVKAFQVITGMILDDVNITLSDTFQQIYKAPEAPFNLSKGIEDSVSPNSGSLSYTDPVVHLDGRAGFNLDIAMQYNSSQSKEFDIYSWVTMGGARYMANDNYSFKNPMYYAGLGWSFNFSRIVLPFAEIEHSAKSLVLSNGLSLEFHTNYRPDPSKFETKTDTNPDGSLKLYYKGALTEKNGLSLREDPNSSYGANVKYVLRYKDGKTEYFDGTGYLLSTQDKYNNKIQFIQVLSADTKFVQEVKIIDTMGRQIKIGYADNTFKKLVVTLPNNDTIQYGLERILLTSKTDEIGRKTTYNYGRSSNWYNFFGTYTPESIYNNNNAYDPHLDLYFYNQQFSNGYFFYQNQDQYGRPLDNCSWIRSDDPAARYNVYGSYTKKLVNSYLASIVYPTGAQKIYTYEEVKGRLGSVGYFYFNQVINKKTMDAGRVYNEENYSYSYENYTYANHEEAENYYSTQTDVNGIKTQYEFRGKDNANTKTTVTNKYGESIAYTEKTIPKFMIDKPDTINSTYNNTQKLYQSFIYDADGNVVSEKRSLPGSSYADYETTYTYDTTYSIPTKKSYLKDVGTVVEEVNALSADKKSVAESSVYENGVLKSKVGFVYDPYGNVVEIKNYYNASSYDSAKMVYEKGNTYIAQKTTPIGTEKFDYDDMGRLTIHTDAKGNKVYYQYDKLGRQTLVTNPDQTTISTTYNDSANRITMKDENGTYSSYQYDGLGNLLSITNDSYNALFKSYTYDYLQRIASEKDGRGISTSYTYDDLNRIKSKTVNDQGTHYETYDYNDKASSTYTKMTVTIAPQSSKDALKTTEYKDNWGRVYAKGRYLNNTEYIDTSTLDYLGNITKTKTADNKETFFTYDYKGNLLTTKNPDGSIYQNNYDLLGRKVSAIDPKGNTATFTYNSAGLVLTENTPFENNATAVKSYTYDANGNVTVERQNNQKPGEAVKQKQVSYDYDSRNRLVKASNYDNGVVDSYTTYKYDGVGNKTEMVNGNGTQKTVYQYDRRNLLVKITDPLGQAETFEYDNNGNMTKHIDRNKNQRVQSYDGMNRLKEVVGSYVNGAKPAESVTYTYYPNGLMAQEKNTNLTVDYQYDNLGRIIRVQESNGTVKSYEYNIANNRKSFILNFNGSNSISQTYEYDNMNRMTKVYDFGSLKVTYTYDKNGNRESVTYPNGVSTTYSYNKGNLITNLSNKKGGTTLSSYTYGYYVDGNQAQKTDHLNKSTMYTYDGLGRLKQEIDSGTAGTTNKSYTFDKVGNRNMMTVTQTGQNSFTTQYQYDLNNRLLEEKKVVTLPDKSVVQNINQYWYDGNGNQISQMSSDINPNTGKGVTLSIGIVGEGADPTKATQKATINTYDVFNRLVRVESEKGLSTYQYKPDGMRLSKNFNGIQTNHVWDGSNIVLEYNQSKSVVGKYNRGIGLISNQNNNYYVFNAHGDVVQLTDSNGIVIKNYQYDVFGNEVGADEKDVNPFRHAGEYKDLETNTYYLRNRYYSPNNGRFLTEDPIQAGLNWYTYAGNNPVMFVDPNGLFEHVLDYTTKREFYFDSQSTGKLAYALTQKELEDSYNVKDDILAFGLQNAFALVEEFGKMDYKTIPSTALIMAKKYYNNSSRMAKAIYMLSAGEQAGYYEETECLITLTNTRQYYVDGNRLLFRDNAVINLKGYDKYGTLLFDTADFYDPKEKKHYGNMDYNVAPALFNEPMTNDSLVQLTIKYATSKKYVSSVFTAQDTLYSPWLDNNQVVKALRKVVGNE